MKTLKVCVIFLILFILIFSLSWSKSKGIEKIGRSHIFSEKTKLQRPIYKGFSNPFLFPQSGPNGYGYTYLDSDDSGGPTYSWIEISATGTQVSAGQWYTRSDPKYDALDDGTAGPFSIGFNFVYNGQTYNQVYIGTNGAISFTHDTLTDDGYFYNAWIPGMRFSDVLAPFWNDLNLSSPSGGGYVYYWTNVANDTFIVEYKNVKPYADAPTVDAVTFELILTSRDSSITFQYFSVKTPNTITYGEPAHLDSFALIGIQDQSKYCGLRYYGRGFEGYDNLPDSGLAVKFRKTEDINHNLLPGKIVSFGFPYYEYFDQPPALLWYVKEAGTSFDDNSVSIMNTGAFGETNIPIWAEISRRDTLGNYTPLYTVGSLINSLGSGATTSIVFPTSWIPIDRGEYFVTYRTELSGDEVLSDDTLRGLLFAEKNLLYSSWASTAPTIDGIINPSEWSDANRYDISKFYLNPWVEHLDCDRCYDSNAVFVYIKNDSNYLYFALDVVKDTSDSVGDWTIFGIDDNGNGIYDSDFSEGSYELRNAPGAGTDSLVFWPFRSSTSFPYEVEYVGTGTLFLGGQFGQRENSGHQQIEIALLLAVSPAYNLNSAPGKTIIAYLGYIDANDTCIISSEVVANTIGHWPFKAIFEFYPTTLGEIYLSDKPDLPEKPILVFPPNGTKGAVDQAFLWEPTLRATSYQLQIDDDSTFANSLIIDTTVTTNGCFVTGLPDTSIWWRVRGINSYGEGPWSDSAKYTDIEFPTDETDDLIAKFSLSQNYPNPFNPVTNIPFHISCKLQGASCKTPIHTTQKSVYGSQLTVHSPIHTTLTIYNILGQRVRTLVDDVKLPGEYKIIWDGKDDKGNSVSSGIYFYRLKAGDFVQVKKMLLIK